MSQHPKPRLVVFDKTFHRISPSPNFAITLVFTYVVIRIAIALAHAQFIIRKAPTWIHGNNVDFRKLGREGDTEGSDGYLFGRAAIIISEPPSDPRLGNVRVRCLSQGHEKTPPHYKPQQQQRHGGSFLVPLVRGG